jgi:arsenite-transporting ATPase
MQKKYIDQIYDLYDLFHIIKLPLLAHEIRGIEDLKNFSKYLVEPFTGNSLPNC